ncbi:hypothetical protein F4805DRAFT_434042 [Annulohypoxylon moriforme]|nr:hypothetical protein F4805DRAFT_434042 [Annulohypoxylon moriforme]
MSIKQSVSQDITNSENTTESVCTTAPTSPSRFTPTIYFFYGTLTQPDVLKRVLDLDHDPPIRPAKIIGYSLTKWGDYKALIDGESGEEVAGVAYEVRSPEHEYKLAYYETNAYKLVPCLIEFTDERRPTQILGSTFKYAGDAAALKEGRFDRRLWEFRMGSKLPEKWNQKRGA